MSTKIDKLRHSESEAKAAARKSAKLLVIPKCEDHERRELLESDDVEWLQYYFGPECGLDDPYTYDFTPQQIDMITAIGYALRNGGDQAIAASRGEGKTTNAERLALKYVLSGECNYLVLFASTGPMAENILDSINTYLNDNERLSADYPEVCVPVRELLGAPQRARSQVASGFRYDNGEAYEMAELDYVWCGNEFIFPKVPGAPSAKAIIATRGLDAAVRGLKKRGKRPKLAIVDDPDTEDTARSEDQATKLEKRIDAAIGGLGGQRRAVGRVILTTLQSRIAVSYKLTDPKQKQTFKGRRYRFLVTPPDRMDLWETYIQMRLEDLQKRDERGNDVDPEGRRSHRFYIEHREEMDAGAVVSNPNRFNNEELPDCTTREASALQAYYNLVAKLGSAVVATEYDNDPPEESSILDLSVPASRIQNQLNGFARGIVPDGCTVVTQGVDVRKSQLHWVVRAWKDDGTGYTIDYGIDTVKGIMRGVDEGLDVAIAKAVANRFRAANDAGYCTERGEVVPVDMTLVDAGWRTDAVYHACIESRMSVMPCKGFGPNEGGATQANFREASRITADKVPGDGWFRSRVRNNLWLVAVDSPYWKAWEHDRWKTDLSVSGCMSIFGMPSDDPEKISPDVREHAAYARQITAEVEAEEDRRGRMVKVWKQTAKDNHWLDASVYSNVAASIKGIRIGGASITRTPAPVPVSERPTLQQLAQAARRR